MGFQLVAYEKLKIGINDSIKAVLQKHNLDVNRMEESISKLDDARRIHCQLLRKYVELLDASRFNDETKARILNGAVYYIRAQIEQEYKYTSKENSTLFNSLTSSLELSTENSPNNSDLEIMYLNLSKFLHEKVYVEAKPAKGYNPGHPFSSESIRKYSVEADLKNLVTTIYKLKMASIDEAESLKNESTKAKSKGILGGLFGGSSSTALPKGGATSAAAAAEFKN